MLNTHFNFASLFNGTPRFGGFHATEEDYRTNPGRQDPPANPVDIFLGVIKAANQPEPGLTETGLLLALTAGLETAYGRRNDVLVVADFTVQTFFAPTNYVSITEEVGLTHSRVKILVAVSDGLPMLFDGVYVTELEGYTMSSDPMSGVKSFSLKDRLVVRDEYDSLRSRLCDSDSPDNFLVTLTTKYYTA